MLKKAFSVFMMLLFVIITGCGNQNGKVNPYFNATVLEVNAKSIIVEPFKGEEELEWADKILVSTDIISTHGLPQIEEGTLIRVVYTGEIAESSLAQINDTFAIYLVDETGELIGK